MQRHHQASMVSATETAAQRRRHAVTLLHPVHEEDGEGEMTWLDKLIDMGANRNIDDAL